MSDCCEKFHKIQNWVNLLRSVAMPWPLILSFHSFEKVIGKIFSNFRKASILSITDDDFPIPICLQSDGLHL